MNYIFEEYISKKYELKVNDKSMYYAYEFPYDELTKYARQINEIPLEEIVENIMSSEEEIEITTKDIFQFSSFEDATIRLCEVLQAKNNPGVTFLEMGKMLLDDGNDRTDVAYRKYGENHLKAAESMGLTFQLTNTYFLSSIGNIITRLNEDEQNKLLIRLILRGPLVKRIIRATNNGVVDMRNVFYMLSDSTYTRRKSNVRKIFQVLEESEEYNFNEICEKLKW